MDHDPKTQNKKRCCGADRRSMWLVFVPSIFAGKSLGSYTHELGQGGQQRSSDAQPVGLQVRGYIYIYDYIIFGILMLELIGMILV